MVSDALAQLFSNTIFLSALLAWLFAQVVKMLIEVATYTVIKIKCSVSPDKKQLMKGMVSSLLWKTGGMPSSHSAMITAVTTSFAFELGITSYPFLISLAFSTIVIRDSVGVRQLVGHLAYSVNILVAKHNDAYLAEQLPQLKVVNGHSMSEVIVGMLLGFSISTAMYLF